MSSRKKSQWNLFTANCQIREQFPVVAILLDSGGVRPGRSLSHLLTTVARPAGPGGARCVVAESVLVKLQQLILNRFRKLCTGIQKY
jgi:hypothetical protein